MRPSDSYVWVRTELVEAILRNHGTLPKNFTLSRKRGRDGSWGWCRAHVQQSSNNGNGSNSQQNGGGGTDLYSTSRLRSTPRSNSLSKQTSTSSSSSSSSSTCRTICLTVKINDPQFAPDSIQNRTVSIEYDPNSTGEDEVVCNANTWWMSRDGVPPDDLTALTHLHEPAVVYTLLQRYNQDQIYTYTGKILLALNPFRALKGVYGDTKMQQYYSVSAHRPPPHIYAIAQDAYQSMMQRGSDQSILVSGESGSGKTVTTKFIMRYLATRSQRLQSNDNNSYNEGLLELKQQPSSATTTVGMESQILQSNPILESFGNARTIRNDNSSRFGKFMELLFTPNGSLISASIETYLLEKVRIISQTPGERNYHIFYELLAGIPQSERRALYIGNKSARDFKMTAWSGTFDRRDGVDDRDTYNELRQALDTVGFADTEQQNLFTVACALLHSSNLTFEKEAQDGSALVVSNPSLEPALALLGVPCEVLNNALCLCAIEARGEVFHKNLSVEQATKALEALTKATYSALFTHIVRRVNESIAMDKEESPNRRHSTSHGQLARIGVLDIFGFESFEHNSFEQLCINYCNEALQQQFNRFVFKLEQQEYEREGIEWSFISFPDNQEILDLIEKRHDGILSILDENCKLSSCTDGTFARAVYDKCDSHERFSATNTQKAQLTFSIHHYAGLVTYDAFGFLEKNKDELPKETTDLLMSSSFDFLASLGGILNERASVPNGGTSSSSTPSGASRWTSNANAGTPKLQKHLSRGSSSLKALSVGSQFSQQLKELRDRIDSTTPHYVRCLKPNDDLVPNHFGANIIADQLRCAGVLEAIRVSRVGFPHRFYHDEFLQRYGILAPSNLVDKRKPAGDQCIAALKALTPQLLRALETDGEDVNQSDSSRHEVISLGMQLGYSKVFLRRRIFDALEFLRNEKLGASALVIQTHTRRLLAQLYFYDCLYCAVTIQCWTRQLIAKKSLRNLKEESAAIKIQSTWRRYVAETNLFAANMIAECCQKYWRGILARRRYGYMRRDFYAQVIQACWRRFKIQSGHRKLVRSSIILQCLWRRKSAIADLKQRKREAKDLGKIAQERDHFKKESARLRRELEEMKRLQSNGSFSVAPDLEVEQLRNEVERLKVELEHSSNVGPPLSTIDVEPDSTSTRTPRWSWGALTTPTKKDETGSTASSSFSPLPQLRRALRGRDANQETTSTPRSQQNTSRNFSPTVSTTSISLLDAEGDADNHMIGEPIPIHYMHDKSYAQGEQKSHDISIEIDSLHNAVGSKDIKMVERLLNAAEDLNILINELGMNGRTALHTAVLTGDLSISRLLIERGAIVNYQDLSGETALHLAEDEQMTNLLLDHGKANPNIPNIDGICALHLAVQRRDVGSVRSLLRHGAKLDAADHERWFTPFHLISLPDTSKEQEQDNTRSRTRVAIANLLCDATDEYTSKSPAMNEQDHDGNIPLHYAVQIRTQEASEIIDMFLKRGADPSTSNNRNQNPLILLCHNESLRRHTVFQECLSSMLSKGAKPNVQSMTGCTALHLTLYHKDIDGAIKLVKHGADLHFTWNMPQRWKPFWDMIGSSNEVLALDMVQKETDMLRVLSAITLPSQPAPTRSSCMQCKSTLTTSKSLSIHCRHCSRHVCGSCAPATLGPEYFPKSFELYHQASPVCILCEKILIARFKDEEYSSDTNPISLSANEEDDLDF